MSKKFYGKDYNKVKKIFENVQQDLKYLKGRFPLGEKEFISPQQDENQGEGKSNTKGEFVLDRRIKKGIDKLTQSNMEWEKEIIKASDGSKKFYRMPILGKKNEEIIRFEKQRFLELRGLASKWNLVIEDPLSREEWDLLSRFIEWNSLKNRVSEQLCQPIMAKIYISNLYEGISKENTSQGQLYGKAFGFYGQFIGDVIEKFDPSKGVFEHYINSTWATRKSDYYKEDMDAFFRPRKVKDDEKEKAGKEKISYTSQSMEASLKSDDENGIFGDFIKDNNLSIEDQIILREALCKTIIELAGNMIRLKKNATLYLPLFYTELVVYLVKIMEPEQFQIRHEKSIFEVMSQSFLDFIMKEICRTILKIQQSFLKTYGEIGFEGTEFSHQEIDFPFRQSKANVYKAYIAGEDRFSVSESSIDATLSKNYKEFEKILHGLFDSEYKEDLLSMFSEKQPSMLKY